MERVDTDVAGVLYIVPTPIGNLEDITLRAINILKMSNFILAEDTRTSGLLLKHYNISTKMFSYHKFNEHHSSKQYVNKILTGDSAALISDAGTPGISDPGFLLIRDCIEAGIKIECLPGATAFVPALVASGLPSERFCFEGFLPSKKGRVTRLKEIEAETRTMIFYESPYRVVKTLTQFAELFGEERQASASREISKYFEQTLRGTIKELLEHFSNTEPRGEFVIIVAGKCRNKNK